MSVRFNSQGEGYVGTTGIPGPAYTVTWWAYISVNRGTYSAFLSLDSPNAYTEISLGSDGLTPAVYNVFGDIEPAVQLSVGTWYAMAYVQDIVGSDETGTGTLYWGTDPESLSSHSASVAHHEITHFRIDHYRNPAEWLNGRLAAIKVWNAALSASEIAVELQTYEPVITSDLLRVHKLQVPEPTDYSGNGHTLEGGFGASTESDPPLAVTAELEPGRFLLAYEGVGAPAGFVYTNRPTQPMRYRYDQSPLADWAYPGALVVAGRERSNLGPPGSSPAYEGTDPGYIAAAVAGATVLGYIDPIVNNDWGLYHELLLHEQDSLGRSVGPAAQLWPGNFNADERGRLNDFRVGSVIQQKFKAVLELMLDENPWLSGFWLDGVGTRSRFPGFSWASDFTLTDRQAYRNGAIELVKLARQVCNAKRMPNGRRRIIIVNGTWTAGTLLENGGGYPNMAEHGCSLVEGGQIEHQTLSQAWIDYASGAQWATEASTDGKPFIVTSCLTDTIRDSFIAADIVSHAESAQSNATVWGEFHETGLPDARPFPSDQLYPSSDLYPV